MGAGPKAWILKKTISSLAGLPETPRIGKMLQNQVCTILHDLFEGKITLFSMRFRWKKCHFRALHELARPCTTLHDPARPCPSTYAGSALCSWILAAFSVFVNEIVAIRAFCTKLSSHGEFSVHLSIFIVFCSIFNIYMDI